MLNTKYIHTSNLSYQLQFVFGRYLQMGCPNVLIFLRTLDHPKIYIRDYYRLPYAPIKVKIIKYYLL